MPEDKSLFFYGKIYHRLFDPQLAEAVEVAVDLVPQGSSVLDIGCGTGELCFALRGRKSCKVVGLDLSLRMLEFARTISPCQDLPFVHGDASDLAEFADQSFDCAAMLMLIHELPRQQQLRVVGEALRVARKAIIIDAVAPLPRNAGGLGIRVVEATFGHDHHRHFKAFLSGGGIRGVLGACGAPMNVEHTSVFWRDCREVVVVSTPQ